MKKTYIEKNYFIERKFEIYGDILKIEEDDILETKLNVEIDLKVLKQVPDTGSFNKFRFLSISFVFIFIFIIASLLCNELVMIADNLLSIYVLVLYLTLYISTLFITRKKVFYNRFLNKDEIVIFSINKIGKHEDEFDNFIEILNETINKLNKNS